MLRIGEMGVKEAACRNQLKHLMSTKDLRAEDITSARSTFINIFLKKIID